MSVHRTRSHRSIDGAGAPRGREPASPRPVAVAVAVGVLSLLGLGLHGVLSGPGDVPASAAGTGPAPVVVTVVARPGDSLWSIAERHRGDVPIQRYVDALVELNGGSPRIDAGQLVHLP
jgi:hypothetical protein